MSETTFTFQVDEALKAEFSDAAKACDSSSAQLLRDLMREFVQQQADDTTHDSWFRHQVQLGLDAAEAGDIITAADVEFEAELWRDGIRKKMASSITKS